MQINRISNTPRQRSTTNFKSTILIKSPTEDMSDFLRATFNKALNFQTQIIERMPNAPQLEIKEHDLGTGKKRTLFGIKLFETIQENGGIEIYWREWLDMLKPDKVTYEIIKDPELELDKTIYDAVIKDTITTLPPLKK